MNNQSVRGTRRETLEELRDSTRSGVGDWWIDRDGHNIYLRIPGDDSPTRWPFKESLPNGACWKWDGNRDKPTITPSLHLVGVWHGWMKNGELISV